jgi:CheY-like chemotaxis protein
MRWVTLPPRGEDPTVKTALRRVLVVEDNLDIRTIVKAALEMVGGLEVRACESGTEALDAVVEFAPQLVLLDVMMPDMDGPGVLVRLREQPETAALPVVFLTAKTATAEIERLCGLGALGVLTKPFDPMTLHQDVQTLWDTFTA